MLEGLAACQCSRACIRACAVWGCGLLELGLAACYANQCWRGHASRRALCGVVECLSWGWRCCYANQGWRVRASGRALRGVVGCLSSGWRRCYANQCWRGRASGRALLELELRPLGPSVQEGGQLVVLGDECALCGIGDRCCFEAQPVHSTSIHFCAKPIALPY
jgi:hypothetical protein